MTLSIATPGPTATQAEWDAWRNAFVPTSGLTADQKFLYALGLGERGVDGEGTSFADRIAVAIDAKPATPDHPASFDAAKLTAVLDEIATEHAADIAAVKAQVVEAEAESLEAYNAATAHFNDLANAAQNTQSNQSPTSEVAETQAKTVEALATGEPAAKAPASVSDALQVVPGGPAVPPDHTVVDVPPAIAEHLPPGTLVTSTGDAATGTQQFVAHVPSSTHGVTYVIKQDVGAALHHIADTIRRGITAIEHAL
jgi:hypothetical protein